MLPEPRPQQRLQRRARRLQTTSGAPMSRAALVAAQGASEAAALGETAPVAEDLVEEEALGTTTLLEDGWPARRVCAKNQDDRSP